ncbi:MAG: hypothetical protein KDB07_01020, partial [Planctomycetes bacterium]|nr:hypothetical protein [Planctomycetota bacterium]
MFRWCACFVTIFAVLGFAGCASKPMPTPVSISLGPSPNAASIPLEWRSQIDVDDDYPHLFPVDEALRAEKGKEFLESSVRLGTDNADAFKTMTLVATNASGQTFVRDYAFTLQGVGAQVDFEEVSLGFSQKVTMRCDASLRLQEYSARRIRENDGNKRVDTVTCRWEDVAGRTGYRVASVAGSNNFFRANEPLLPDDLVPLLPFFANGEKLLGNFVFFSPVFRGAYGCGVE